MSDRSTSARDSVAQPAPASHLPANLSGGHAQGPRDDTGADRESHGAHPKRSSTKKGWFGGDDDQTIAFYGDYYR